MAASFSKDTTVFVRRRDGNKLPNQANAFSSASRTLQYLNHVGSAGYHLEAYPMAIRAVCVPESNRLSRETCRVFHTILVSTRDHPIFSWLLQHEVFNRDAPCRFDSLNRCLRPGHAMISSALPPVPARLVDSPQRKAIYQGLKGAHRKSFGTVFTALLQEIALELSAEDQRLFVSCRNSLVHQGRFYCQSANADDRSRVPPHAGPTHEYFWLLHVVDRMFLRLLDYNGPYVDWTEGKPKRRMNVCS
jgi:hypothetical protein